MDHSKEVSDLSLKRVECEKCGATWINGKHVWKTGNPGNEADLAGLVCNKLGNEQCINPARGTDTGDSWAKRLGDMESGFEARRERMEDQRARWVEEFGEDAQSDD